jgi:integrase
MLSQKEVAAALKESVGLTNERGKHRIKKHPAGHGLYLIARDGQGWWTYQFREGDKIKSKGLGSVEHVTPSQAEKARENYAVARRTGATIPGVSLDPAGEPFAKVRDAFLAHNASMWDKKQRTTYANLLRVHAAKLDHVPVNKITTAQVAECLRPIWAGPGHNRGSRLRSLIERAINGHVQHNPATWDMLQSSKYGLEIKRGKSKPHEAMLPAELPAFFAGLDMADVEHRAIAFTILTGVRREEALGACWREIDVTDKKWSIPGERMKEGRDHFVPLSDAALAVIGEPGEPDAFLFPSRRGGELGHDALSLRDLFGLQCVLHGFRTTLASWAEEAGYRVNVILAALAHGKKGDNGRALGSQDTAYMRATLYSERKALMDEWGEYVLGERT